MRLPFTKAGFDTEHAIKILREKSILLHDKSDLDLLIEKLGDANIVMLGEASHGTHEYYTWRSYISRKLIEKKILISWRSKVIGLIATN